MSAGPRLLADPAAAADWLTQRVTGTLVADSRRVKPGDGFLAWPGLSGDGRNHVAAAFAAGAVACLVEEAGLAAFAFDDDRVASLVGLKAGAGAVAHRFFGAAADALSVVAATGTNGKTSTVWWIAQALSRLGQRCAAIGTLGIGDPGAADAPSGFEGTGLTTPDAVHVHAALRRLVDSGYAACAIEASSIGLVDHRLAAVPVTVALLTNFTRDHLDFHGSMAAYWAAKRELFDWPGLRAAVINIDDAAGARLADDLSHSGRSIDLWTTSLRRPARLTAGAHSITAQGMSLELTEGDNRLLVRCDLVGEFNAANLLGVVAALRALGISLSDAAMVLPQLTPVPGRLQRVASADDAPLVFVDYAHTPDALEKALQALSTTTLLRGGRLWCVFGCGGNRDATKRPLMGAVARGAADELVLTSDNPRQESPALILAQIGAGISASSGVAVIEDRRVAIRHAIGSAANADVILIAGKGHEDYQDIAGVKRPFSDLVEAAQALQLRGPRPVPEPDRNPEGRP
jgi:UDP-N-acetylmuramoyl-L-alanyl-D-glutamate--2,6-diaminopimelate ligase